MLDSLSLSFTLYISLIILISARCNATSFSMFSVMASHFHVEYNSIHTVTRIINLSSHQQGNTFSSEEGGHGPKLEPTTVNAGGHSSITDNVSPR